MEEYHFPMQRDEWAARKRKRERETEVRKIGKIVKLIKKKLGNPWSDRATRESARDLLCNSMI